MWCARRERGLIRLGIGRLLFGGGCGCVRGRGGRVCGARRRVVCGGVVLGGPLGASRAGLRCGSGLDGLRGL